MFERFTERAREVVVLAQEEARRYGDDHIDTRHLLAATLAVDDITTWATRAAGVDVDHLRRSLLSRLGDDDARALDAIGISLEDVRRKVEDAFGPGALDRTPTSRGGHIPFTKDAKRALESALREALLTGNRQITAAHVSLGIVRSGGAVNRTLTGAGVDPVEFGRDVQGRLGRPNDGPAA